MIQFSKVSFEQFYEDFKKAFNMSDVINHGDGCIEMIDLKPQIQAIYDKIELPTRATTGSAGYDFHCPIDINIAVGTSVKIPTGIKCEMDSDIVLFGIIRSSLGFKYEVGIVNQTAVVDSDYFYSDNEGHIFFKLHNYGDKDCRLNQGDRFAQGVFLKYEITDDDNVTAKRNGGMGSTNERKTS